MMQWKDWLLRPDVSHRPEQLVTSRERLAGHHDMDERLRAIVADAPVRAVGAGAGAGVIQGVSWCCHPSLRSKRGGGRRAKLLGISHAGAPESIHRIAKR